MNSRNKGATGERELAKVLRGYGYNCRRGQQYCGANGDADVVGLPGLHIISIHTLHTEGDSKYKQLYHICTSIDYTIYPII